MKTELKGQLCLSHQKSIFLPMYQRHQTRCFYSLLISRWYLGDLNIDTENELKLITEGNLDI